MKASSKHENRGKPTPTWWPWILVSSLAPVECSTHFGSIQGDLFGYIDLVKLLRVTATLQEVLVAHWHGMLRPVVPLLALSLSFVTDYPAAIILVNTCLILAANLVIYAFRKRLVNLVSFRDRLCGARV